MIKIFLKWDDTANGDYLKCDRIFSCLCAIKCIYIFKKRFYFIFKYHETITVLVLLLYICVFFFIWGF